jgi:hypothetical protein
VEINFFLSLNFQEGGFARLGLRIKVEPPSNIIVLKPHRYQQNMVATPKSVLFLVRQVGAKSMQLKLA